VGDAFAAESVRAEFGVAQGDMLRFVFGSIRHSPSPRLMFGHASPSLLLGSYSAFSPSYQCSNTASWRGLCGLHDAQDGEMPPQFARLNNTGCRELTTTTHRCRFAFPNCRACIDSGCNSRTWPVLYCLGGTVCAISQLISEPCTLNKASLVLRVDRTSDHLRNILVLPALVD